MLPSGFPEGGSRAGSGKELAGSLLVNWSTGWRLAGRWLTNSGAGAGRRLAA